MDAWMQYVDLLSLKMKPTWYFEMLRATFTQKHSITSQKTQNLKIPEDFSFSVWTLLLGYFLEPTLMHTSIWTCMSHYPRHVSGPDMPIFRRNNCTNTAFGILALLGGCTLHRLRADSRWACQGPKHVEDNVTYMFILKCALKLILKNILYIHTYIHTYMQPTDPWESQDGTCHKHTNNNNITV